MIAAEQKGLDNTWRAMSQKWVARENFLHAQVQASAQYCHQHLPPFPTTTKTTKTIEPRLPHEKTVAKRHRGRRPMSKSPTTETLVSLVPCRVNWLAQGNNCVYCCVGQEEDDSANPARAFHRHHEYSQSECPVQIHRLDMLLLTACSSHPILSQM
jgi:hypothetical protein